MPVSGATLLDNVVNRPFETEYYRRLESYITHSSSQRLRELCNVRLVRGFGVNDEINLNNARNNNINNQDAEMPLIEDISDTDINPEVGNIRCLQSRSQF